MHAKTNELELLAPAGSPDAAWAALAYGADAVYAGLPRFSARAEADNFTLEALDELIGFAHAQKRRVYITLNTLVQQHELPDALTSLAQINELNADGVIVQDMGVARLVKKHFPNIELHASTQLAAHNLNGARELAAAGFSRVVLARELSAEQIHEIAANCGIETEVFIHGALCYSYSGLCLFSSHLNSRSGNRGRCAYSCRQTFTNSELPFAMRDLSLAEHLDQLVGTGVKSLKIEGRMKSPLYVAAVTDFYRKHLAGDLSAQQRSELLTDIQTIFGRPATDLYYKDAATNPIDPLTNGHRGALIGTVQGIRKGQWLCLQTNRALQKFDGLKIELPNGKKPFGFPAHEITLQNDPKKRNRFEVPAHSQIEIKLPEDHPFLAEGADIYCSFSQEVRQRYTFETPRPGTFRQHKPVDINVRITASELHLKAGETELTVEGTFEPARQPERSVAAIQKSFAKMGETEWSLGKLDIDDADGLFVPASILNDARRQLLEKCSEAYQQQLEMEHFARLEEIATPPAEISTGDIRWSVKLRDTALLDQLTAEERELIDEVILETDGSENADEAVRVAIPVIQRDATENMSAENMEVSNIGGLYVAKKGGAKSITADWPLYVLNTEAAKQWQELGITQSVLSPEDTGENLKTLIAQLGDQAIVPIFQYTPLMISATKPDGSDELTDRSNNDFNVERNGAEYVLVNTSAFSLVEYLDELKEAGAQNFRIDFCYGVGSARQAADLFRWIMAGTPLRGSHSANFDRTL